MQSEYVNYLDNCLWESSRQNHSSWIYMPWPMRRASGGLWMGVVLPFHLAYLTCLFGQRKNRWPKLTYHSLVLPFSFPFSVFLVMLYLHVSPAHSKEMLFLLLHSVLELPFPRQLFKWKYCGLSNAADHGSNPGSAVYERCPFAHLSPQLCQRKSRLFQGFLSYWKITYICPSLPADQ